MYKDKHYHLNIEDTVNDKASLKLIQDCLAKYMK